jgi:Protein of unknown function (DUF3761)
MRAAVAFMLAGAVSVLLASQALASRTATVSLLGAHPDGSGSYSVLIADSRPASKLVLYVDGAEVGRAVVSGHRRAAFRYVELEGVGKLSFAEVRTRSRGGHYLARLGYARYFQAAEGHIGFSTTEPAKVVPPTPAEPPPPAAPPPAPPPTEPVCLNGSYTNSEGNKVCKPQESPTPPPGATARCNDGTYSFSEHRSGTCSYHGGVAEWLV